MSEIEELELGESKVFIVAVPTEKRGRIALERFGVRTMFPFELFKSWAWLHMDLRGLVYASAAMHEIVSLAVRVAPSEIPVLITGPNGTGKELLRDPKVIELYLGTLVKDHQDG